MAFDPVESFAESLKDECPLVSIYIGKRTEDSTPYIVPKSTLCRRGQYFQKALSSTFSEGKSRTLHFPEDDENGWKVLLYWLYHDRMPKLPEGDDCTEHTYFRAMTHAYILADKYQLPRLHNKVVLAFMDFSEHDSLYSDVMVDCIEILPTGCSLRKVLLEDLTWLLYKEQRDWFDVEDLATCEGVVEDLLTYTRACAENPNNFPPHWYGKNESEVKKYLLEEEKEE